MKTRTFTSFGSLHPILFFAVVYIVALFFSIFICSSLFYSCNSSSTTFAEKKFEKKEKLIEAATTVAYKQ